MMDNSSIPFDERLWQAYVRTTYRVLREDEKVWDIQIGLFHPAWINTLRNEVCTHGYSLRHEIQVRNF